MSMTEKILLPQLPICKLAYYISNNNMHDAVSGEFQGYCGKIV